ncbi:MAG: hypothetical protein UDG94_02115 [Peptococcaceae bacterium]|nr:hypothetical protein [Peptococcaceae bacterium]
MTIIDFAYSMTAPVEAVMFFLMFDAFFERRRQFAILQYIAGVIILAFSSSIFIALPWHEKYLCYCVSIGCVYKKSVNAAFLA